MLANTVLVAQPENPLAIGDHDRVDLATRPVAQDLRQPVPVRVGQEQATGPPVGVTELLAGQPHRRCVNEREHLLNVVGDQLIEEHFIGVLQRAQVDMPGQVVAVASERLVGAQRLPRDAERALARWGLLGEGAAPVFASGARYPLAGLLLALPAMEGTGMLAAAREVYGRLRDRFYGLTATLLTVVFLALAGEPRAEGATRVPPGALGRVLGLDRAPEVKTIRRKMGELAAAGKAAELIMALGRRHAAARPDALGFLSKSLFGNSSSGR